MRVCMSGVHHCVPLCTRVLNAVALYVIAGNWNLARIQVITHLLNMKRHCGIFMIHQLMLANRFPAQCLPNNGAMHCLQSANPTVDNQDDNY